MLIGLILSVLAISLSIVGCNRHSDTNGSSKESNAGPNPSIDASNNHMPEKLKNIVKNSSSIKQDVTPRVEGFSFVSPSTDWIESEAAHGDGTYTKAVFSSKVSPVQLTITSIGLPAKGDNAKKLVKDCETEFAVGMSKHPELTREWIKNGFSISRFADSSNGDVSVWCTETSCKVQLNFTNGIKGNTTENIKLADNVTDSFFEKNPSSGAKTK